ncbi:MAG: NUDIX domain-containing protein [Balneolaceae bacterium]
MTRDKIQPIDAAGGVLYRVRNKNRSNKIKNYEVLLIRRRGVWDLPKGKREEEESFEHCAVREVEEETGAPDPVLESHLTDTYHEYREGNQTVGKTTRWYAMSLSHPEFTPKPQLEEEIEQVQWFSLAEAREKVGFKNLIGVLDEFEKNISDS